MFNPKVLHLLGRNMMIGMCERVKLSALLMEAVTKKFYWKVDILKRILVEIKPSILNSLLPLWMKHHTNWAEI